LAKVLQIRWRTKISDCPRISQKISGTFRSVEALVDFCRTRGYVSTARKNGLKALDALQRVFHGTPFLPTVNTS
jgi:hypothetical protein